jgi:hypothetical protein
MDSLVNDTEDFYNSNFQNIIFWETPVNTYSLIKIVDGILAQVGLKLVIFEAEPRFQNQMYNTCLFMDKEMRRLRKYFINVEFEVSGHSGPEQAKRQFIAKILQALDKADTYKEVKEEDFHFLKIEELSPQRYLAELQISSVGDKSSINDL